MTAPLPVKGDLDGSTPDLTQGQYRTAIGDVRDYLHAAMGDDGADKAAVQSALKLVGPATVLNLGLAFSFGSNALTVAVKDGTGAADPSAASPVIVPQRDSTAANGLIHQRAIAAALSLVISSGATLGMGNASSAYFYLYAMDNGGAQELAVSATDMGGSGIATSLLMSGSATSGSALYSGTARSNLPYRALARFKAPQTVAGTYIANPTSVELWPWVDAVATVTASGGGTVRQTVASGSVDTNGYANFLSAGSGLAVSLAAAAVPVRMAFAQGNGDLTTDLTADSSSAFGSAGPLATSFLFSDYASAGTMTGSNTLCPPQYGYTFDRTRAVLCHFEGTNGQTTTKDDQGNTVAFTNATISTAAFKFGASSLLLNGTTAYADITGPTTFGGGSVTLEGWCRRLGVGTSQVVAEASNASNLGARVYFDASNHLNVDLSSNGSSNDIGTITGATAVTVDGLQHHWALVYDLLAGKYFLYLDGVSQGTAITSALHICAFAGIRLGATRVTAASFFNGYLDEVRLSPFCVYPNGVTFTPPSSAFAVNQPGQLACWFDIPNMVMREVTAASASAGTNPTFTARNRVFVGEADAGASSVSAVRSYAYNGRYHIANQAIPSTSTRVAFQHNLGGSTDFMRAEGRITFKTPYNGFSPGMSVDYDTHQSGTGAPTVVWKSFESSTVFSVLNNSVGPQIANSLSSPSSYNTLPAGSGTATFSVDINRGW